MCHNDEEPGRGHRQHNSADRLAIAVCRECQPQDAGQDNRQLIKYFQKLQLKNVEVAEKVCVSFAGEFNLIAPKAQMKVSGPESMELKLKVFFPVQ